MTVEESVFFAPEALEVLLLEKIEQLGLPDTTPESLLPTERPELVSEMNDRIVALLRESELAPMVVAHEGASPPPDPHGFGMRIWSAREGGRAKKTTFFRVKKAWPTAAVNCVGIALALGVSTHVAAIVPSLNVIKGFWENIVTLKRPEHGPALDAFDAFLRAQAAGGKAMGVRSFTPSTHHIRNAAEAAESLDVGLQQAREVGLLEITAWGGEEGHYEHPDNQWKAKM